MLLTEESDLNCRGSCMASRISKRTETSCSESQTYQASIKEKVQNSERPVLQRCWSHVQEMMRPSVDVGSLEFVPKQLIRLPPVAIAAFGFF
jgi:hypothetical protein